jgi:hypothetical protein
MRVPAGAACKVIVGVYGSDSVREGVIGLPALERPDVLALPVVIHCADARSNVVASAGLAVSSRRREMNGTT